MVVRKSYKINISVSVYLNITEFFLCRLQLYCAPLYQTITLMIPQAKVTGYSYILHFLYK